MHRQSQQVGALFSSGLCSALWGSPGQVPPPLWALGRTWNLCGNRYRELSGVTTWRPNPGSRQVLGAALCFEKQVVSCQSQDSWLVPAVGVSTPLISGSQEGLWKVCTTARPGRLLTLQTSEPMNSQVSSSSKMQQLKPQVCLAGLEGLSPCRRGLSVCF